MGVPEAICLLPACTISPLLQAELFSQVREFEICAMLHVNHRLDPKITQHVTERLAAGGIRSPSRVTITTAGGVVTMKGTIQYEHQRHAAMQATHGVDGVRRVVDRLQVMPVFHRSGCAPPSR